MADAPPSRTVQMSVPSKKIVKEKGQDPETFELDVAQALCDLEANSNDLKAELRELYITSAKGEPPPACTMPQHSLHAAILHVIMPISCC